MFAGLTETEIYSILPTDVVIEFLPRDKLEIFVSFCGMITGSSVILLKKLQERSKFDKRTSRVVAPIILFFIFLVLHDRQPSLLPVAFIVTKGSSLSCSYILLSCL